MPAGPSLESSSGESVARALCHESHTLVSMMMIIMCTYDECHMYDDHRIWLEHSMSDLPPHEDEVNFAPEAAHHQVVIWW